MTTVFTIFTTQQGNEGQMGPEASVTPHVPECLCESLSQDINFLEQAV